VAGGPEWALSLPAAQLLGAPALPGAAAPLAGPVHGVGADTAGSMLALGALGTGLAYVLNFTIIRRAGATIASTVTYVIPLFSTALGILVLGERPTWNEALGALVVLAGVACAQAPPGRLSARGRATRQDHGVGRRRRRRPVLRSTRARQRTR
jgi:drug/metabolite transporter (DMT)-like permease